MPRARMLLESLLVPEIGVGEVGGGKLARRPCLALGAVKGEVQAVADHAQAHVGRSAGRHGVHAIHLRGGDRLDRINERLQPRELAAHLRRGVRRVVRGLGGVEGSHDRCRRD